MPLSKYLNSFLFIVLFSWISFFPAPIQEQYWIQVRIFFGVFLAILILRGKNSRLIFSFKDWPLWIFLICLLSGTVTATDKNQALRTYFYIAGALFPLFYIGKCLYGSEKNINMVICICAGLVAAIGITELYFGKDILYEKFIFNPYYESCVKINHRPISTQFHAVVLGSYLLGCFSFCFSLFGKKPLYLKLLGILIPVLCAIVIIFTSCRGVVLGLVALLLFYLWKSREKRVFILFLLCLILLIMFFSYQKDYNFHRFESERAAQGNHNETIVSEFQLCRINASFMATKSRAIMTYKMLKDHPFFGIGLKHFRIRFNEYYDKAAEHPEISDFMIPDNMYLTFLAETGIVGTLAFLVFISILLKRGIRRFSELKDENKKDSFLIPLSAFMIFFVTLGAYDLFYWNNPYALFCLVCGFLQGSLEEGRNLIS